MTYSPRDHIRVYAIRNEPWFVGAGLVNETTEVTIRVGRDDPTRQPDPPTATLKLWNTTADQISDAHLFIVAYWPTPVDDTQPVGYLPVEQWRFAGRPVEATTTWQPLPTGELVPVTTIPLASLAAYAGKRKIANMQAVQQSYSHRVFTFMAETWPVFPGQTVNAIECKPNNPQDESVYDAGPPLAARPNRPYTDPPSALKLAQETCANMADVLRHRRCGQAWFARFPFATVPKLPWWVITDPRVILIGDAAAGWDLDPIINRVNVRWGPNYANANETTYAGTVDQSSTASIGAYDERGPVVIDTELTAASHATQLAAAVLARRAWPRRVVPRLTIDLTNPVLTAADRDAALSLETGNTIRLGTGTPLDTAVGLATVEAISETITPTTHLLTLTLVSAEIEV